MKARWWLAALLTSAACGGAPHDDCPGGQAGRPGCPSSGGSGQAKRSEGATCPPSRDLVPEVSWGPALEMPQLSVVRVVTVGSELLVFDVVRWQLRVWSETSGWRLESLPCVGICQPRGGYALAVDEETKDLYMLGGSTGGSNLREVQRRVPGTGEWVEMAPLPELHQEGLALVHQRRLLLFGGFVVGDIDASDRVFAYDLTQGDAGTWSELPRMPERRVFASGARVGSFYYQIGGLTQNAPRVMAISTLVYDLTQGTWTSEAPIPTPRHSLSLLNVCDRLLVMNGISSSDLGLSKVEMFDPIERRWRDVPQSGYSLGSGSVVSGLTMLGGQVHVLDIGVPYYGHHIGTVTGWAP